MKTPYGDATAPARSPKIWARRTAKRVVRSTSGAFFRAVGAEAPAEFVASSCLVLAPHPDDETLGCGALIARKRAAGSRVTVVIVADGGESPRGDEVTLEQFTALRQEEARAALAELGVGDDDLVFLGFEDGKLSERIVDIADALAPVLRERSPEQVLVTSIMDRHPDHAAVGRVGRLARERGDLDGDLLEYAIWQRIPALSTTVGALRLLDASRRRSGAPSWRTRVSQLRPRLVRTDGHLQTKREALRRYPSQLPYLPLGFVDDFLRPFEVFLPVPPTVT